MSRLLSYFVLVSILFVFAQNLHGYTEPAYDRFPWKSENLRLGSAKFPLIEALVSVASNFDKVPTELKEKALAVALRIDPDNKYAFKANFNLSRGNPVEKIVDFIHHRAVRDQLHAIAQRFADETSNADEQTFAKYVNDVVTEFEVAIEFKDETRQLKKISKPSWSRIIKKSAAPDSATPAPTPPPPMVDESSLTKLKADSGESYSLIVTGSDDSVVGGVSKISASRSSAPPNPKEGIMRIAFDPPSINTTALSTSIKEAIKYLRYDLGKIPDAYEIELKFSNEYEELNGPSATLACALAIHEMITGEPNDHTVASIADINADGSLQPVGSIHSELAALGTPDEANAPISLVIIPDGHEPDAHDTLLIHGTQPFIEKQIFKAPDFKAALALAQPADKRSDELAETLKNFSEISDVLKREDGARYLRNAHVIERLKNVAQANPNHISSMILYLAATNQTPKSLSLGYSIGIINDVIDPILKNPNLVLRSRHFDTPAFAELKKYNKLIDKRLLPLVYAIANYAAKSRLSSDPAELEDARDRILKEYDDIGSDVEIREILMK